VWWWWGEASEGSGRTAPRRGNVAWYGGVCESHFDYLNAGGARAVSPQPVAAPRRTRAPSLPRRGWAPHDHAPLAALLAHAAGDALGDLAPVLRAVDAHEADHLGVLLRGRGGRGGRGGARLLVWVRADALVSRRPRGIRKRLLPPRPPPVTRARAAALTSGVHGPLEMRGCSTVRQRSSQSSGARPTMVATNAQSRLEPSALSVRRRESSCGDGRGGGRGAGARGRAAGREHAAPACRVVDCAQRGAPPAPASCGPFRGRRGARRRPIRRAPGRAAPGPPVARTHLRLSPLGAVHGGRRAQLPSCWLWRSAARWLGVAPLRFRVSRARVRGRLGAVKCAAGRHGAPGARGTRQGQPAGSGRCGRDGRLQGAPARVRVMFSRRRGMWRRLIHVVDVVAHRRILNMSR
jgi:hypothetical protein